MKQSSSTEGHGLKRRLLSQIFNSRVSLEDNAFNTGREAINDEVYFQKTQSREHLWTKTDHFYTHAKNLRHNKKSLRVSTELQDEKIEPYHPKSTTRSMEHANNSIRKLKAKESLEKQFKLVDYISVLKDRANEQVKAAEGQDMIHPTRSDVKKAFTALELLIEQDSPYNQLMQNICKILNKAIYPQDSFYEKYSSIWSKLSSIELKVTAKREPRETYPFFRLCLLLVEELQVQLDESKGFRENAEQLIRKLRDENLSLYNQMEEIVNIRYKTIMEQMVQEHQNKVNLLTAEMADLSSQNEKLKLEKANLIKMNASLIAINEMRGKELDEANFKVEQLQKEVSVWVAANNKANSEVENMKRNVQNFRENLDNIMLQVIQFKKICFELKFGKEELERENERLHIRAAAGFEELTPRPNYEQIQKEKDVELNFRSQQTFKGKEKELEKIRLSTREVVEGLLNKHIEMQNTINKLQNESKLEHKKQIVSSSNMKILKPSEFRNSNDRKNSNKGNESLLKAASSVVSEDEEQPNEKLETNSPQKNGDDSEVKLKFEKSVNLGEEGLKKRPSVMSRSIETPRISINSAKAGEILKIDLRESVSKKTQSKENKKTDRITDFTNDLLGKLTEAKQKANEIAS